VYRVRTQNPRFVQAVGRLAGGVAVMEAAGFVLVDGGKTLELRALAASQAPTKKGAPTPQSAFKFPSLDPESEAFLYRRKADFEAALLDLESDPELSRGTDPAGEGRALVNASDAAALGAGQRLGGQPRATTAGARGATGDSKKKDSMGAVGGAVPEKLQREVAAFMKGKTEAQQAQLSMLRDAFVALDSNRDGFVDARDLLTAWRLSGQGNATEKRATEWVRARDMDADDRVAFDEFVASFSALLAPSSQGWEKGPEHPPTNVAEETDKVGASLVQAAFGALRLRATLPEQRAAAQLVVDLVARALASPHVAAHWRVDLERPDVRRVLGRLYGGPQLLGAMGFEPEDGGRALALRPKDGKPWKTLPPERVAALQRSLAELEALRRGLDHPEVADVACVSAAVAMLRDQKGSAAGWAKCIDTVHEVITNVLNEADAAAKEGRAADEKFRTINTAGAGFAKRLGLVDGSVELLVAMGFREASGGGAMHLPADFDPRLLRARAVELRAGLSWLEREVKRETAAAAQHKSAAAPAPAHSEPGDPHKAPAASAPGGKPPNAASTETRSHGGGGKSSGGGSKTAEALAFEQKKRREAESALAESERETTLLRRKLAAKNTEALTTLTVKDTVTLMRMDPQERNTVSRMAKALGITSKVLDAADTSAPEQSQAIRSASAKADPNAKTQIASKATPTSVKTVLDADAPAGSSRVTVASMAGFLLGYRVRIGSGSSAEDRHIAGFGSLVLDFPLSHAHHAGEPVVMLKPTREEAKAFKAWQLQEFIVRAVLEPAIAVACVEGQRVLSARRQQVVFLRRPVDKHVFCVDATSTKLLPGKASSDSISEGQALVSIPALSQIIAPAIDKSGRAGLAVGAEGLSLHRLRRFFDAAGADAPGPGPATAPAVPLAAMATAMLDKRGRELLGPDAAMAAEGLVEDLRAAFGRGKSNGGEDSDLGHGEDLVDWPALVSFFRPELELSGGGCSGGGATEQPSFASLIAGFDIDSVQADTGIDRNDIVDMAIAFRAIAQASGGHPNSGLIPADIAAASEELDGAFVAEEEVMDFLVSAGKGNTGTDAASGQPLVFFPDFAAFRQQRIPLGGYYGCGGWQRGARARLLVIFRGLATRTSHGDASGEALDPYGGEDWAADRTTFVQASTRDSYLGPLLKSVPLEENGSTLLESLQRLGTLGLVVPPTGLPFVDGMCEDDDARASSGAHAWVGWDAIEACVYPPPLGVAATRIVTMDRPISFIACHVDAAAPRAAAKAAPCAPEDAPRVYETAVDTRSGQLFVLLDDGELQVWDATSSILRTREQLIVPERPSARGRGVELQRHHAAWRVAFRLDRDLSTAGVERHMPRHKRPEAVRLAKEAGRRLLALRPRMQLLAFDEAAAVLVLNTTAGDQSVCFHEPLALRRLARVRIALPPMASFDPCLFQQYPDSFPPSAAETSSGALLRFAYLSASELVVATVAGSHEAGIWCSATGTKLACLVGHGADLTALMWAPQPEYALTGCEDGSIRVWDLGSSLLPEVATEWLPYRREQGLAACSALTREAAGPNGETAALEATLVAGLAADDDDDAGIAAAGMTAGALARARFVVTRALELTGMRPAWKAGTVSSQPTFGGATLVEVILREVGVSCDAGIDAWGRGGHCVRGSILPHAVRPTYVFDV